MTEYKISTVVTFIIIFICVIQECNSDGSAKIVKEELKGHNNKTSSSPSNTITQQTQTPSPPNENKPFCNDSSLPKKHEFCPSDVPCENLGGECIECNFNCTCIYGTKVNVTCAPIPRVKCSGGNRFQREVVCRYCYQTEIWEHTCDGNDQCKPVSTPRERYKTNCTVKSEVTCLGNRRFPKMLPCNWTSGYNWATALILSITLGGFGADRFYLGHWEEGVGKLFSFGGLGVWTIMDVILIAIRYLGPEDGSLYI